MSEDPLQPDSDNLREELVAYLDGELDAERSRRVEQLLADDPAVRRTLQSMDRTWQMLEAIESPDVDEGFTQTTLEMVAVAAAEDAAQAQVEVPRRRRRGWLLAGAALLAAGLAGFLGVAWLAPDPNAQLLRDLPLLENFDRYRQIDDAEFLRMLEREKLFAEAVAPPHVPAGGDDSPAARRQRIEDMTPAEKEDILHHQQQFAALGRNEQQRLRQLHDEIESAADGDALRETMYRYCHWLASLPPISRGEFTGLKPAQRVERIKQLRQDLAENPAKQLGGKDREEVARWMEEYVKGHEARMLAMLPEGRRQQVSKMPAAARHRIAAASFYHRWAADNPAVRPRLSDTELADLLKRLSPETRARLEAKPAAEQPRIVGAWLRQVAEQELTARRGEGVLSGLDEQLADFFEELGEEEQDRLMSLPGKEMQRQLQEMYLTQMKTADPGGRRPDWFGHGKGRHFKRSDKDPQKK